MKMGANINALDGFQWRCRQFYIAPSRKRVRCDEKVSIRRNTFFNESHLSLFQLVVFSYLWIENVPLSFNIKETRMSKKTAIDWSRFNREVVIFKMITNHDKIGGVGKTVDVGESNFGRRKSSHAEEGQWVFGGVERDSGRCFLIPVEARTKEILLGVIQEWILTGTTIISNCWKTYDCLDDDGYLDLRDNYCIHFVDPDSDDSDAHTNTVERMWRRTKASFPEYGWKKRFLEGYLAKFMFLSQCRFLNLDPLREFFEAANKYSPVHFAIKHKPDSGEESEN